MGFAAQREKLGQKLGLSPLLKVYTKPEEWQKELAKIDKLIQAQGASHPKAAGVVSTDSQGRIAYLVEDSSRIELVLQKSKNGQKWSKGRNVSLLSMAEGTAEFMSKQDTAFASAIHQTETWHGTVCKLNIEKAFIALINHPHVYLKENRDISVQIVGEEPYIEVSCKGESFCVSSNVKTQEDTRIIIQRVSQVLYKVIQISVLQRDILRI